MTYTIETAAAYFPDEKRSIKQLAENCGKSPDWSLKTGIQEVHIGEQGLITSEFAVKAAKRALEISKTDAQSIDQLVWISEGINDYLYMDTSKTIIQKIGGRVDGEIHSYDFYRGTNGTIGFIKLIGNQVISNPTISASLISSAVLWEYHSRNRLLGPTFLGDGAGAILLKEDQGYHRVLSISLASMSEAYDITCVKPGGTRVNLSREAAQGGEFLFDILDEKALDYVLENVVKTGIDTAKDALESAQLSIDDIDFIGIAGFHKDYNESVLKEINKNNVTVLDQLNSRGYLGSIGIMNILDQFFNNDNIASGSTLLAICIGIDINVECMVIRK